MCSILDRSVENILMTTAHQVLLSGGQQVLCFLGNKTASTWYFTSIASYVLV
jgi:hypothetical protein